MTNNNKDETSRRIELLKKGLPLAAAGAAAGVGAAAGAARGAREITIKGLGKLRTREKTGAGYVTVAAILYLLDYFIRWFDGLNIEKMLKTLPQVISLITGSIAIFLVLTILLFSFTGVGKMSKRELFSFLMFIWVTYLCLILSGFSYGHLFHIAFALWTWLKLRNELDDPAIANNAVSLGLFLDFVGGGLIGWMGFRFGMNTMSVFGNRVLVPVWFIFSLIYTSRYEGEKPLWLKLLVGAVITFYLVVLAGENFAYADYAQELSYSEIREAKTVAHKAWDNIKGFSVEVAYGLDEGIGSFWEGLIMRGAGPYYGYAEDTPPVGIFLEVEEPEAPVATKASFYAEVEAKTLGIIESVPVTARCWWGEDYEEENEGIITPSKVEIYDGESETFRCKFEALSSEADEITFEASASGLESTGELPVFFIDKELKREMKKKGEDLFFGYYAGKSVQPRMTYTNGPLGIGTTALNQPISINKEDVDRVLGIRLINRWDKGEISSIKSLNVTLPRGVELSACDHDFAPPKTIGEQNTYSFDTSEFEPLEEIDEEAYFLCDMTIKVGEKSDLISGPVKAHPRFFYIHVEYDFVIKDSVQIELISVEGEVEEGEGRPPGEASPAPGTSEEELKQKIIDEAEKQNVPWEYALAIAYTEHAGSLVHDSVSPAGAVGLFQIMSFHVGRRGICEGMNRYDLDQNIKCGVRILKNYYFGSGCDYFHRDGCRAESYCGWDRAARYYVGWACKDLRHDYYVELVNCYIEQINKQTTITMCDVDPDGRVYY